MILVATRLAEIATGIAAHLVGVVVDLVCVGSFLAAVLVIAAVICGVL
jgi:hypothetical protein